MVARGDHDPCPGACLVHIHQMTYEHLLRRCAGCRGMVDIPAYEICVRPAAGYSLFYAFQAAALLGRPVVGVECLPQVEVCCVEYSHIVVVCVRTLSFIRISCRFGFINLLRICFPWIFPEIMEPHRQDNLFVGI